MKSSNDYYKFYFNRMSGPSFHLGHVFNMYENKKYLFLCENCNMEITTAPFNQLQYMQPDKFEIFCNGKIILFTEMLTCNETIIKEIIE